MRISFKRYFFFSFVFSFAIIANAETIIGNCYILDKPLGENQFQLSPGTAVDCSAPQNGWCMILFKAYIDKKYVYDGIKILHNAHIRNEKGKNCGRAYIDFNPYRTILENDTCFIMEIAGYIETMCIEDTSIVEHEIEKIYFNRDSLLSISKFNKHLNDFKYEQWRSGDKFYSFLLREKDIVNPKPGFRVIIIFERDKAIAILHRRSIKLRTFESVTSTQKFSVIFLGYFSELYKKKIDDIFLHEADKLF